MNSKTIKSITRSFIVVSSICPALGLLSIETSFAQEIFNQEYKPRIQFMINGINFIKLKRLNLKMPRSYY